MEHRKIVGVVALLIVALFAWFVVVHPWWSLGTVLVVHALGMWWAWHELTKDGTFGLQRLWMSAAWPFTLVMLFVGRVQ